MRIPVCQERRDLIILNNSENFFLVLPVSRPLLTQEKGEIMGHKTIDYNYEGSPLQDLSRARRGRKIPLKPD
jgi:hypothetical protein